VIDTLTGEGEPGALKIEQCGLRPILMGRPARLR